MRDKEKKRVEGRSMEGQVETHHKAGEYDYNLQTVGVSLPFPFFPFFPHSQFTIDACAINKTYNFLTRVTFSSLLSPPFITSSLLFLPPFPLSITTPLSYGGGRPTPTTRLGVRVHHF